jgi:hypothetical protein
MSVDIREIEKPAAQRDPFYIGSRPITTVGPDGTKTTVFIPMTEEDFLHPQLEDRLSLTDFHTLAVFDLRHAIVTSCRDQPNIRVLSDHLVDWQVGGLRPHSPDIAVFRDISPDWDFRDGQALRVKDAGAEVLAVIEVTSDSTRHIDLGIKFDHFERVGIPYYLVADLAAPHGPPRMLGFRRTRQAFREMRQDPKLGFFVPELKLWFDLVGDRVQIADEDGRILPDAETLATELDFEKQRAESEKQRAEAEKQRAEAEKQRAEAEKQRAETEKQRADSAVQSAEAEKQRADELARELAELKARLAGQTPKS